MSKGGVLWEYFAEWAAAGYCLGPSLSGQLPTFYPFRDLISWNKPLSFFLFLALRASMRSLVQIRICFSLLSSLLCLCDDVSVISKPFRIFAGYGLTMYVNIFGSCPSSSLITRNRSISNAISHWKDFAPILHFYQYPILSCADVFTVKSHLIRLFVNILRQCLSSQIKLWYFWKVSFVEHNSWSFWWIRFRINTPSYCGNCGFITNARLTR